MFVRFLKQRGSLDLHTTEESQALEPLGATKNAMVHRFFFIFHLDFSFPFQQGLSVVVH